MSSLFTSSRYHQYEAISNPDSRLSLVPPYLHAEMITIGVPINDLDGRGVFFFRNIDLEKEGRRVCFLRDPERSCSFGAATEQDDQPRYQSKRLHFNASQAMHLIPVTVQGRRAVYHGRALEQHGVEYAPVGLPGSQQAMCRAVHKGESDACRWPGQDNWSEPHRNVGDYLMLEQT
jgi:hypothetical protein